MAKKPNEDDLDTTTSFADMNVEGFKWYDPERKKEEKKEKTKVTRKEYWAMVKGAFLALAPFLLIAVAVFGVMFLIAWLWLK